MFYSFSSYIYIYESLWVNFRILCKVEIWLHSFPYVHPADPTQNTEDSSFPIELTWHFCQKSTSMGPFLDSILFY
jgi:hypothetical protein